MMKNNIFGKLLCGTLMLFAAMSFTACVDDNEDVGMPYLELDSETLPFALEGGHATFTVKTNRPWFITKDEASDWLTVEPMVGDGTAQVEILLPEATTGREATLTFNIANSYGVYLTKTMKIQQGEIKPAAVLWHENFGTPSQTSNAWPTVANYTGWEKGGLYGADVTYSAASDKAQIRGTSPNSVGYADASGAGKLFIGTGMPAFVVGNIQTDGATNYTLNFGGAYFNYAAKDETFYSDKCHIYVSGDNAKWSELTYTVAEAEEGWVYATALFTLKEAADKLYIKLAVDEASCFSIDDMQLASGGAGGQEIDLANGTEGEGGNEGEEPTPGGDGTSDKTFPGAGKYLLLAKKEGAFVAATPSDKTSSYFYPAATAVTPANNALAADDTTNALAWTIAATSTEGQYTIAMPNNHYCYGTADYTSFNISNSVGTGGYTWTFTPHTDGSWKLLCVDYSKTLQYSAQHNSFGVYKEDADSYIYLYQLNAGGTAYELVGENAGGGEGEEPTPDTPTDATATDINALIGMMGSSTVTLDKDYTIEGVVLSDVTGGNYTGNNLVLQTEGSTTAKNGVVLFGSQVDPVTLGLSRGDKVKVTLLKDKAQLKIYNDLYEITGDKDATWCSVEKIGTGTVAPTVITVSQMKDFQSMLVTIKDVTISDAGTWCTADAPGNHTFTAGGSNLTVYVKKAAAAFADKEFKATTGDMTGIVTMYNGAVQLAPRDLADVATFMEGGTTPEPEPEPEPSGITSIADANTKILATIGTSTDKIAFTEDITVQGIVMSDKASKHINDNAFIIQDATTAGSGMFISLYGVGSASHDFVVGDKIELSLKDAKLQSYNGLIQVYPASESAYSKVGTATPFDAVTVAPADLNKYQSMYVQVTNVSPVAEFVGQTWNNATNKGTVKFKDASNTEFAVYTKSACVNASSTIADKTGTLKGIVGYFKVAQLQPRDAADIAAFTASETPDPTPEPEPEPDPTPDPSGDVYFWKDDFSQFNSETGDSSTDLGANLKGSVDGFTESYQSVAKIYAAAAGTVKGGSSSVKGTLTTPAMKNVSGTAEAMLSVDLAAWVGSAGADATKMVIKVNNGGTIDGAASVTTEQLTAEMKTYTFNLAGITSATTITIEASAASKKRFYLDNLIIKQK